MRFTELDPSSFADTTVFLDVDGTIVADAGEQLSEEVVSQVKALAQVSELHLCSNGDGERTRLMADGLGVSGLPKLKKPFRHPSMNAIRLKDRTVVIGDKFLTDGLLALRLGAEFVMVERMRERSDGKMVRLSYALDALAFFVANLVSLIRVRQWIKNLLVLSPLFFAGALFDVTVVTASLVALLSFSLAASAVYVLNDILDREQDRMHSRKRYRPIAAGRISVTGGYVISGALIFLQAPLLYFYPTLIPVIGLYIFINSLYSFRLKHVPVVDVLIIASCYVMRVAAGSSVTDIPLSPWIVLCVFFVSLFVIVGKRRAEYAQESQRIVLRGYSKESLDALLAISAGLAIITYALYTIIGRNEVSFIYSTLFVAFALFRVLNDIYANPTQAEAPEYLLFKDLWILGAFLSWGIYMFFALYLG